MIKEQQEQISLLYLTLQNLVNTVERASKYEKERKSIMCENRELKEKCENMENDYSTKLKEEIRKVENKYEDEKSILWNSLWFVNSYIGYVPNFQFLLKKNLLGILNLKMIFILIQKNRLNMRKN